MRAFSLLSKAVLLGLGGGAAALLFSKRQRPANQRFDLGDLAPDPADPVQSFDDINDLHTDELELDATTAADQEVAQDLAALELDTPSDTDVYVTQDAAVGDSGDLYGVHTPRAVDREHPDDDVTFEQGENWLEALSASATEYGAEPEAVLDDIVDDDDIYSPPHATDTRDIPVADRGSGGTSGL